MQRYDICEGRWWSLVDIGETAEKLLKNFRHINTIVIDNEFDGLWWQHLGSWRDTHLGKNISARVQVPAKRVGTNASQSR